MNPGSLDSHAGSYRINTVIIRLNRYFCPLTGNPDNLLNGYQPVVNFGDILLKKTFQEFG